MGQRLNEVVAALVMLVMAALALAVPVWFVLVSKLFRRLETEHPEKFHEMGDPGIFMNNSPHTTIALTRFLFGREDAELDDEHLVRLARVMRVFYVTASIAMAFVFVSILTLFVMR